MEKVFAAGFHVHDLIAIINTEKGVYAVHEYPFFDVQDSAYYSENHRRRGQISAMLDIVEYVQGFRRGYYERELTQDQVVEIIENTQEASQILAEQFPELVGVTVDQAKQFPQWYSVFTKQQYANPNIDTSRNKPWEDKKVRPGVFHISDIFSIITGVYVCDLEATPTLPRRKDKTNNRISPHSAALDLVEHLNSLQHGYLERGQHEDAHNFKMLAQEFLAKMFPQIAALEIDSYKQAESWISSQRQQWYEIHTMNYYNGVEEVWERAQRFTDRIEKRNPSEGRGF